MRKARWMVNLLLFAGATGLGWKLAADWRAYAARNDPQAIKVRPLTLAPGPRPLVSRDYSSIALQNPFYPDRNDVVALPNQARPLGPPPLFYGSVILGKDRFALLATEANPKPQKVNEGETFEGYKVGQVRPESVVFETSAGPSEVMLYNAIARLHRQYVKTAATASASSGLAAAGPTRMLGAPAAPPPPAAAAQAAAQSGGQPPAGSPQAGSTIIQTPWGPRDIGALPH